MRLHIYPLLLSLPVSYVMSYLATGWLLGSPLLATVTGWLHEDGSRVLFSVAACHFLLAFPVAAAVSAFAVAATTETGYETEKSWGSYRTLKGWALRAVLAQDGLYQSFAAAMAGVSLALWAGVEAGALGRLATLQLVARTLSYTGAIGGMELLRGVGNLLAYSCTAIAFAAAAGMTSL